VKGLREDTDEIAERAAKAALKEMVRILPQPGGLSDLDALKQGFIEIKALQEGADRRTQQTLKAVHNALETLVNRLPPQNIATMTASGTSPRAPATGEGGDTPPAARLEAAVRKLHAAAVSHVEEVASTPVDSTFPTEPEEILIEPGAPRAAPNVQVAAVASSQEAQPASVRANFIAAARRAAQAVQAEKDAGSQVSEPEDAPGNEGPNPPISNQTLIERIRQTFDHHRRPLLLTLAFLVLAAGAAQIVAGMRKAEGSPPMQPVASEQAPAPAPVPELPKTAIGKASQVEPGTPVITGSLLQPPPVASPISANAFSTVKRIPDVAAVGDLPTSIPPGLREAALAGDAAAVYEVASRASDGRDGAPDPTLAARLFEKAAKAGLAPAQYRLGNLYEKGLGVPRDAAAAKSWYERAAASGNARSMHNLGVLLAEGVDGKPEYAIAQKWFLAAAELGVRDSQYNLGVLLVRGLGIGQDLAQSYKWFALAARQGDEDAGRKRDEVAARLTPADLAAQKAVVESWRAREPGQAANEAPPPPQGWSAIRPVKGRG
jgi:localization factor PodJL